ncbi:putative RNA-directed DNA polymerase from transposon X-element [Trichonephila clavipes]|uniref:Putative RNA-directed DNA polymerase from transposon X-element n=1 Tax=Trichonephila clavipes TaxID=2585209 RepID=A0A8X6VIW7_TRICX|nr:putative RNA-directed DNA polymerase from transposon X-element [Trichonephila clavipes]
MYPKSKSKLSGEFLKIFAATTDDHREITALLKEKGEQFFALNPTANRPQKVVIKGLPITTDIGRDLTSRGFQVLKKPRNSLKLKPNSNSPSSWSRFKNPRIPPDIFKLETCCYLSIKIDNYIYNRRPGAAQCYNCNLFHHSSNNCHIQTRCLKWRHDATCPPTNSEPEATEAPREKRQPPKPNDANQKPQNYDDEAFGFMDAILELKKFFADFPSLLELGRQLRNAQGTERVDVFYRHLISLK